MKIRPILPLMLLLAVISNSQVISYDDLLNDTKKHHDWRPDHKKVVEGNKLFIKKYGLVCDKLKVGKLLAGSQLSFNNKGCNTLFAKGTKEKNLLNLRSTFCFDQDPDLSCFLNNDCTTNGPAVGCLDLSSSFLNGHLKLRSGAGIGTDKATVRISGTACQSQIAQYVTPPPSEEATSIQSTSNVQIEVLIPLFFCLPFCDRPALQATYDDNSCEFKKSICVKDKPVLDEPINNCPVYGHSVTTFLGASVDLRNITRSTAFVAFTLRYQNCIGLGYVGAEVCNDPIGAVELAACKEQKKAIVEICKHANTLLKDACFDINAEGRIL